MSTIDHFEFCKSAGPTAKARPPAPQVREAKEKKETKERPIPRNAVRRNEPSSGGREVTVGRVVVDSNAFPYKVRDPGAADLKPVEVPQEKRDDQKARLANKTGELARTIDVEAVETADNTGVITKTHPLCKQVQAIAAVQAELFQPSTFANALIAGTIVPPSTLTLPVEPQKVDIKKELPLTYDTHTLVKRFGAKGAAQEATLVLELPISQTELCPKAAVEPPPAPVAAASASSAAASSGVAEAKETKPAKTVKTSKFVSAGLLISSIKAKVESLDDKENPPVRVFVAGLAPPIMPEVEAEKDDTRAKAAAVEATLRTASSASAASSSSVASSASRAPAPVAVELEAVNADPASGARRRRGRRGIPRQVRSKCAQILQKQPVDDPKWAKEVFTKHYEFFTRLEMPEVAVLFDGTRDAENMNDAEEKATKAEAALKAPTTVREFVAKMPGKDAFFGMPRFNADSFGGTLLTDLTKHKQALEEADADNDHIDTAAKPVIQALLKFAKVDTPPVTQFDHLKRARKIEQVSACIARYAARELYRKGKYQEVVFVNPDMLDVLQPMEKVPYASYVDIAHTLAQADKEAAIKKERATDISDRPQRISREALSLRDDDPQLVQKLQRLMRSGVGAAAGKDATEIWRDANIPVDKDKEKERLALQELYIDPDSLFVSRLAVMLMYAITRLGMPEVTQPGLRDALKVEHLDTHLPSLAAEMEKLVATVSGKLLNEGREWWPGMFMVVSMPDDAKQPVFSNPLLALTQYRLQTTAKATLADRSKNPDLQSGLNDTQWRQTMCLCGKGETAPAAVLCTVRQIMRANTLVMMSRHFVNHVRSDSLRVLLVYPNPGSCVNMRVPTRDGHKTTDICIPTPTPCKFKTSVELHIEGLF